MGNLIGISNIGPWMSKRYIDRYGFKTKWAKQFQKGGLLISTNGGLWRENAQGYTNSPADAGRYDLETAWACIKDLGPEKHANLILPQPVKPKAKQVTFLVDIKATLEITAGDVEEAAFIAQCLSAPMEVPPGCVIVGVPRLPEEDDAREG